jgi:hypothetical protein
MAKGIIQEKMARPEGDDLTLEAIQKNIKMPPELQEAYERVVVAGMKVMFSKESHQIMLKEIQAEGEVSEKLGRGITGLMLLLFKESNQTIPPQVIIPAGVELLVQAADFVRKSGVDEITNADIGDAIEVFITMILDKFGADSKQIMAMVNQYSGENLPPAEEFMGA